MDQKNTIVKCTANPNCLFNHNGVCDNYVINIGADGKCEEYVETEDVTIRPVFCEHCDHYEDHGLLQNLCNKHECYRHRKEKACVDFTAIRGQRAKCNVYDDICDYEPFLTKAICSQCRYDPHGNLCSRKNVASNGIWTCWEKKE